MQGFVPPRHPRGALIGPPRVAGMGAQKRSKTPHKTRPPGAYSCHPRGALIGPRGWRDWAPKAPHKTRLLDAHSRHPRGDLDRPPRVAGMGAQKAPETAR